jgi:hypothetical protein
LGGDLRNRGRPLKGEIKDETPEKFPYDEFTFSLPSDATPSVSVDRAFIVSSLQTSTIGPTSDPALLALSASTLTLNGILKVTSRAEIPQIGVAADTDLMALASELLTVNGNLQAGSGGAVTNAPIAYMGISHPSLSAGLTAEVTDGTYNRRFSFFIDHANSYALIQSTADTGICAISIRTGNTERVYIGNGSEFNVPGVYASTTASAVNVYVAGNGRLYRSTSSLKYKSQVEDLDLKKADGVLALRPVWYRSKCEGDNPSWGWYGLIAEEVKEVDPTLVQYGGKGEPEGVDYVRVGVLLLKEFQDYVARTNARIDMLEKRVSSLIDDGLKTK